MQAMEAKIKTLTTLKNDALKDAAAVRRENTMLKKTNIVLTAQMRTAKAHSSLLQSMVAASQREAKSIARILVK